MKSASLQRRKAAIYSIIGIFALAMVLWKTATVAGITANTPFLDTLWWAGLILWGSMIVGFLFQPMVKERFVTAHPRVTLKDYETLMGYYPIVVLVVLIGSFLASPLLYGSQVLFVVKSPHFWWAITGTGILNVAIFYLVSKGMRYGDVSLVSVTLSLAPVFAIPISFIIYSLLRNSAPLGSPYITTLGAVGIFATVAALVIDAFVNRKAPKHHPSAPKNDWLARRPLLCGILSSFASSIAVNFDKVAIDSANPFLAGIIMASIVSAVTFAWTVVATGIPRVKAVWREYKKEYIVIGIVYGIAILVMNITLVGHNVNYYGAIKRTSFVFGAVYGLYVLNEGKSTKEKVTRLMVSIVVFAGIFLILLKG